MKRHHPIALLTALLLSALTPAIASCEAPKPTARAERAHAESTRDATAPKKFEAPPRVAPSERMVPVGQTQEAELRPKPGGVVDGDTLKVVGFAKSLRLINVDTEEVFKDRAKEAKAAQNWEAYRAEATKSDAFKTFATPMGERATSFARAFFRDVEQVTLEYQSPIYTRGFFDRHLVMVWVKTERVSAKLIPGAPSGEWLNYNVEAVRAGMSPYYSKYGYNMRLHEAFRLAERQAKEQRRGIWAPGAQSYGDYDARIAWWNEMAEQIQKFRAYSQTHPDAIDLASDVAYAMLRQKVGQRVIVFGNVKSFAKNSQPQRLRLVYRYRRDLPVVAVEPVDMRQAGIDPKKDQYIYVEGVVGMYRGDPEIQYDEKSWMRSGQDPPER